MLSISRRETFARPFEKSAWPPPPTFHSLLFQFDFLPKAAAAATSIPRSRAPDLASDLAIRAFREPSHCTGLSDRRAPTQTDTAREDDLEWLDLGVPAEVLFVPFLFVSEWLE